MLTATQVLNLPEEKQIRAFSNGTEAMIWHDSNCNQCVKACHSQAQDDTLRKYVSSGKMCRLQYFMTLGWITGYIPKEIADEMGDHESSTFFPKCNQFSDDDNDRWHPPKRPKPDKTPPNQLLLFTEFDDLIQPKKQLQTT